MERSPAVAGSFYPAEPESLRQTVEECLSGAPGGAPGPALALLVPHAGYVYSGRTAGRTYSSSAIADRVLMLGPNHTGRGRPAAIWPGGTWRTPLGSVPVDERAVRRLLEGTELLKADIAAHRQEHSLEVQVPFLQHLNADVEIVPVCLADVGVAALVELGGKIAGALDDLPGTTLIVISSDMTHYAPREVARRQDRLALDRIESLDAPGLYEVVRSARISMCGVVPAVVGITAAVRLGASTARLIDYTCSGDVTGDDADVVSYAGLSIS
ncbi:MAG: AmmeMemoRadiSam system protein B [Acidobacteriota bacterium]